jgi:hypothetical protein
VLFYDKVVGNECVGEEKVVMMISGRSVIEKMIAQLEEIKREVDGPAGDPEKVKATLAAVKAYCDILLEAEKGDASQWRGESKQASTTEMVQKMIGSKELKGAKDTKDIKLSTNAKKQKTTGAGSKPARHNVDKDGANGDSIFDF